MPYAFNDDIDFQRTRCYPELPLLVENPCKEDLMAERTVDPYEPYEPVDPTTRSDPQ